MSTAAQIRTIHALKGKAGLADHQYRSLLLAYDAGSSKELDEAGAERVIADLRRLSGERDGAAAPAVCATGPFAPKLQSLWISAHNLGLVVDRTDRGLLAFVEGQTGLSHTRFVVDAKAAASAIEGLKAWIARDGGVRWPTTGAPREAAQAVCEAIAAKLLTAGDEVGLRPCLHGANHGLPLRAVDYRTRDFHALANLLGARLRARRAPKAEAAPKAPRAKRGRKAA